MKKIIFGLIIILFIGCTPQDIGDMPKNNVKSDFLGMGRFEVELNNVIELNDDYRLTYSKYSNNMGKFILSSNDQEI